MITKPTWLQIAALLCICSASQLTNAAVEKQNSAKQTPHHKAIVSKASAKPIAKQANKQPVLAKQAAKPAQRPANVAVNKPAPIRKTLAAATVQGPLSLGSASALVLDTATGNAVFQKNPGSVVPIASISKLMTAMVVLDANLSMDEVISIDNDDVDTLKGSHSRLPVGASMTRETALLLALMSSDNRAAHALSRHYPGGSNAFVTAMNEKARSLGMSESRFLEPTGLSSRNVSTAHDLAQMVMAAAKYAKIRELSTTADAKIQIGKRQLDFHNTNALVRGGSWDIGVSKTGYISEAGRCLVMQARVAERPVVIVLLDSVGKMTRVGDAVRIKRWMEQASLQRETRGV